MGDQLQLFDVIATHLHHEFPGDITTLQVANRQLQVTEEFAEHRAKTREIPVGAFSLEDRFRFSGTCGDGVSFSDVPLLRGLEGEVDDRGDRQDQCQRSEDHRTGQGTMLASVPANVFGE